MPALRSVFGVWFASHCAVALTAFAGARLLGRTRSTPDFLGLWDRWDVGLFVKVARDGYFSPAYSDRTEANFPGLPLLMRAVHVAVPDWVAAGLLISLLASAVAFAAVWRLAADEGGPDRGRRAVLLLVTFPYAVFLFAGYSESLFLAFAATAWLAARRKRWVLAGLLACGASATRVSGIALALALFVEYFSTWRQDGRSWRNAARDLPGLGLAFAPIVVFVAFLHARTGDWDAYTRAQREGWGRRVRPPWEGFRTTLDAAMTARESPALHWFWWAAIVAVLAGMGLGLVLLFLRRWGEATFVLVGALTLSSSSYWGGGSLRGLLISFPLFLLLARWQNVLRPYLWLCAPLAVVFVVAFTSGVWVD